MEEKYYLLLSKDNKDELTKEDIELLSYLKSYDIDRKEDIDLDLLYTYARCLEKGFIDDPIDTIEKVYKKFLEASFEFDIYEIIEAYPHACKYCIDYIDSLDLYVLAALATFFYYNEEFKDPSLAFQFAKKGAYFQMSGIYGGFSLVDALIKIDNCRLILGDCYMYGLGTKRDLVEAAIQYTSYRKDHLCQKNSYDDLGNRFYLLFDLMKEESDKGLNYPGLHYFLAVFYRNGQGTDYNYKAYLKCIDKEIENYKKVPLACPYDFLSAMDSLYDYPANVMAGYDRSPIKTRSCDYKNLKKNDYISLGTYDNKAILWKVLSVEDGKALLLASECLESNYIAKAHGGIGQDYSSSFLPRFVKGLAYDIFGDKSGNSTVNSDVFEEQLVPDEDGNYVFLLSKDQVKKYLRLSKSRMCSARLQARCNGYDGCGVYVDEDTNSAYWWTKTEENGGLVYVNELGEFEIGSMQLEYIGIRPAIWLKLE